MRRKADKYVVRLPDGMREAIRAQAEFNRRSMNAEIIHCLDGAFNIQKTKGAAEAATSPRHGSSNPDQEKANEHARS